MRKVQLKTVISNYPIDYNLNHMSENEIMIPNNQQKDQNDQQYISTPVIDVYEPFKINEQLAEESLRQFYRSLELPTCGDYLEPSLQQIGQKKKKLNKQFLQAREFAQIHKKAVYDGVFDNSQIETQSNNQLIRQKSRIVRDMREQFFKSNSQFVIDNQFYHDHLSRLANISLIQNLAIQTFQKNAILSQRNNQKKSMPYQLEINLGFLEITRHQLQNQQEIKFSELRPLMKQFSDISSYPTLLQISRQIQYLNDAKKKLVDSQASHEQISEIIKKIQISNTFYNKQVERIQKNMKSLIEKWRQIKEIRRAQGMQTVPWRLNVKQYQVDGHKSFDIGVTPTEVKKISDNANQNERRIKIQSEKYFIKIFINGYQVAESQKVTLDWPSYKVAINQKFNVTVYSAPSSIQVQILRVGIINRTVDTINLSLPGINSKTITSSQRRFAGANFAFNGHKVRKGEQQAIAPAGTVIYRIEWKGQGSRMPPVSFKAQQEQTAPTQKSDETTTEYPELYDLKDPRMHQKSKKQEVQAEIIKAHGALLPFIDTQSARHLLLKMKAIQPELEKLEVPLRQQQITRRQDLMDVIQNEKFKAENQADENMEVYNPVKGIFQKQQEDIIKQIKELFVKIQNLKINVLKGNSSAKYKITEQIINEYIFEQMQSPIVVFFKNLFTQKRKLGPKITYYLQAKNVIDNMEVNIHMRAGKNVPVRESSFGKIKNFQQQVKTNALRLQQMASSANMGMYGNYGAGFFQRPPNMNIQGQNFFVPGMMNMNQNNSRIGLEANYQNATLERNNTYIEVRFKKLLKRTQCFEGPFPEWNQTIQFDYNLKHQNMTVTKLYANNQKLIKLFLFDMTEESKPTTSIAEARIKKTKYYLGRIDIPFSMLVSIPTLTGLFNVQRPLIIFGYGIKKAGLFDIQYDVEQENKTEYPEVLTMINLDMFSEPLIDSLHAYNADKKFVTGAESTLLLQKSSDWLGDLNTKMYIRLWLNNIQGKSVFICRYLSENISPPPKLQNSLERCARFVSLIPKKYLCKLMQNTEQFHLTCDQLLNMKMGEDHGILLCNYFNYIDKRSGRDYINSFLAIGKAFPYGKSIFVLRRNSRNGDCQLWDPYAGHCYFFPAIEYDTFCCFFKYTKKKDVQNQKDSCNLLEIGSIVSATNVYINMQDSLKPEEIDFNIDEPKLWRPFLTERMKTQYFERSIIESIQNPITQQFYPGPSGIQSKIQTQLFEYLRTMLESDRKQHFKPYTFRMNSNVSNSIRNKLLLECETFRMDYRLTGQQSTMYMDYNADMKNKYSRAIDQIQQQKNKIKALVDSDKLLYGFTLNLPFTTNKDIWEKVQQTQIHLNQIQNISFVLAVRCFEISCHIFSVWIFVGSIA